MPSEQSEKNLEIWNKLERTNPRFTKEATVDGQRRTTIRPMYSIKKVTAALGPVGFAWGWHLVQQHYQAYAAGTPEEVVVHTATVRAWFRQPDGSTREVDGVGTTKAAYWTRPKQEGAQPRYIVDDEAAKKSLTDALSKIMSVLGASADVWLGTYDPSWRPPRPPEEQTVNTEAPEPAVEHDTDGVVAEAKPAPLRNEPRTIREIEDVNDPMGLAKLPHWTDRVARLDEKVSQLLKEGSPATACELFWLYRDRMIGRSEPQDKALNLIENFLLLQAPAQMKAPRPGS